MDSTFIFTPWSAGAGLSPGDFTPRFEDLEGPGPPPHVGGYALDQIILNGVMGQLSVVLHARFLEDAGAIGADGSHA